MVIKIKKQIYHTHQASTKKIQEHGERGSGLEGLGCRAIGSGVGGQGSRDRWWRREERVDGWSTVSGSWLGWQRWAGESGGVGQAWGRGFGSKPDRVWRGSGEGGTWSDWCFMRMPLAAWRGGCWWDRRTGPASYGPVLTQAARTAGTSDGRADLGWHVSHVWGMSVSWMFSGLPRDPRARSAPDRATAA